MTWKPEGFGLPTQRGPVARLFQAMALRLAPHERWFGVTTLILSAATSCVGFPLQIWDNYQQQACGLNIVFIALALLMYSQRIPYVIAKRAWYLLPTDLIGFICTIVLFWQCLHYTG